jgi:hypothetical protein
MSRRRRTWPWHVAAVTLAVLTLAVGLCLFDGDEAGPDNHAGVPDLCAGLLASVLTVTLLPPTAMSQVLSESLRPISVVTLRGLDPPPRSVHLS